jgi:hypothetical protein
MDDILIYSKNRKDHDRLLDEVLKRKENNNFRINLKRYNLA